MATIFKMAIMKPGRIPLCLCIAEILLDSAKVCTMINLDILNNTYSAQLAKIQYGCHFQDGHQEI